MTQQPHVGGTIAPTVKAYTPEFPRAKRLKKSLPEKKPVICVTINDEMAVDEPTPAIKQETKAKSPQVSYKLNKALPLHLSCFPSSPPSAVPSKSNFYSHLCHLSLWVQH